MSVLCASSQENKRFQLTLTKGQLSQAIWENDLIEPIGKLLLLSFSRHRVSKAESKEGAVESLTLSLKALCQETNSCLQTVSTHLKKLQELGYLLVSALSHKKRAYAVSEKLFLDYEKHLMSKGLSPAKAKRKQFEGGSSVEGLWKVADITSSQKLLLIWLGAQCQDKKSIFSPHSHEQEKIRFQINLSKKALIRAINGLEREGILTVREGPARSKEYTISENLFLESSQKNRNKIQIKSKKSLEEKVLKGFENMKENTAEKIGKSKSTESHDLKKERNFLEWTKEEAFRLTEFVLDFDSENPSVSSSTIKEFSYSLLHKFGIKAMRSAQESFLKEEDTDVDFQKFYERCQEAFLNEKLALQEESLRKAQEQIRLLDQQKQEQNELIERREQERKTQEERALEKEKQEGLQKQKESQEQLLESQLKTEDSSNPYPAEDFRSVLYSLFKKHYKKGPPSHFIPFLNSRA